MFGALKWLFGLGLVASIAVAAGVYFAFFGAGPQISYITPDLVPISANADATAEQPPVNLPAAVILPVPFTSQAPLNNWADRQHTCEEASMVMVDRYLKGDHNATIDARTADQAINQVSTWKPALDLTSEQVGEVAKKNWGYNYKMLPADRLNMKQQLALGRPLLMGVRTHGLGNPNYPGYRNHFEEPAYSVAHFIVVIGYDQTDHFVLNDPGLTRGASYHITYDQLMHAIDDHDQAYPALNSGRVFLVLAPAAA
jgi:uncharacterized protein YvpB